MKTIGVIFILVALVAIVAVMWQRISLNGSWSDVNEQMQSLPPVVRDFTTPEGAILCLEDAYRRKDIEAAIAAKDFKAEARLMLASSKLKEHMNDDQMIDSTAEALLVSFRAHTTAEWPNFDGLESFFTGRDEHSEGVVIVTELCRFPDARFSQQKILVAETPKGWRVLNPIGD
jgi:hypothetical protein